MNQTDYETIMKTFAESLSANVGNRITNEMGTGLYSTLSQLLAPLVKQDEDND